ncbi:protein crumbs [Eurytemora carolleeae]|uniref:protein crumbs n=1 Tax=Eurytemora carolleeae TaxID=1294199 RepID=UPI000C7619A4|nr:protein crumbs [Eurytemora carolleeae]XP_023336935.1 protein crumbs [Eurytemora carolleeae]|eukprot:XP_023336933.1 protein crumbs-like [Eurytemora affinis]
MGQELRTIFTFICLLTIINDFSNCCQDSVKSEGCRIVAAGTGQLECLCGMGCKKEFPFHSKQECEKQLTAEAGSGDMCLRKPCKNNGVCVQLKYGGYRCECTGTKFFGRTCELDCPERLGKNALIDLKEENYPLECLMI